MGLPGQGLELLELALRIEGSHSLARLALLQQDARAPIAGRSRSDDARFAGWFGAAQARNHLYPGVDSGPVSGQSGVLRDTGVQKRGESVFGGSYTLGNTNDKLAAAATKQAPASAAAAQAPRALADHCFYCFDILCASLDGHDDHLAPAFPEAECPLFVSWYKGGSLDLRGCIGSLSPITLHSGLKNYALTSAFKDRRFSPIEKRELSRLHCGVSLLTHFEPAADYLDWEIGVHGLVIEFHKSGQRYSATYLPDVCPEQGWNKVECINSLIKKAGWHGAVGDDLRRSLQVTRYQGTKCMVSWDEYQAYIKQIRAE
eukprot:tig00021070_g17924.t1